MAKRVRKRKERFEIRVTSEEMETLEMKANKYGYRYISPYVREASLNEQVSMEDIVGKQEVLSAMNMLIKEVQLLRRDHRYNFRLNELKEDDQKLLESIQELKEIVTKNFL